MSEPVSPPLTLEADSVELKQMNSPEWEICINLSNGESLYHYTDHPDGIVDQLHMDITTDEVVIDDD